MSARLALPLIVSQVFAGAALCVALIAETHTAAATVPHGFATCGDCLDITASADADGRIPDPIKGVDYP